jgi:hypothetical protein
LEEDEYLVLQAITALIDTRARIAKIQASLVRILRFISYERAYAFPGHINRARTLFEGVNCHPFMYQECVGRANPRTYWNRRRGWELPGISGQ